MKQHKFLAIDLFKFKIDSRYRVKFCLNFLAYSFSVTFRISKSDHLVIITDTKYQRSTFAIGKGRYTF